jgi:hypothetical protein
MSRLKLLLVGVILLVALGGLAVAWYPPPLDWRVTGIYDASRWNGMDRFASFVSLEPVSLQELPDDADGTTLLVIAARTFSLEELIAFRGQLFGGGTLVIANEVNYGNQVLKYLGLDVRFAGPTLLDPVSNHLNPNLPVVTSLRHDFAGEVGTIILNQATIIEQVPLLVAVARSSPYSFLDMDGDGELDEEEPVGPFPVAARMDEHGGNLLLVADASLFINGMQNLEDNQVFSRMLMTTWPTETVMVYEAIQDGERVPALRAEYGQSILGIFYRILTTPGGLATGIILGVGIAFLPVLKIESRRR